MKTGNTILLLLTLSLSASNASPTKNERSHNLRFHSYSGPLIEEAINSKFSEAHSLEIRLCNISEFSKDVLSKLQNMESLTIAFSRIQKTEDNAFENCCPKLRKLEIRKWEGFNPKDLKGIGTLPLESLEIFDENIPILESEMFQNKNLKELRLVRDDIETIKPTAFDELINLEYLLLGGNKLRNVPKAALTPLKKLKTLELVSNGLQSLTADDLPVLPSLEKILITNENIKEVNFTDVRKKAPKLVKIYFVGDRGVHIYGTDREENIVHNLYV